MQIIDDFTPQIRGVILPPQFMTRLTDLVYIIAERRDKAPVIDIWDYKDLSGFVDDDHYRLEHAVQTLVDFGHIRIFMDHNDEVVYEILIKKLKKRMTKKQLKRAV